MKYTTIATNMRKDGTHDTIITKHDDWTLAQINKVVKTFGSKPITMLGHCSMMIELETFGMITQIVFISEEA